MVVGQGWVEGETKTTLPFFLRHRQIYYIRLSDAPRIPSCTCDPPSGFPITLHATVPWRTCGTVPLRVSSTLFFVARFVLLRCLLFVWTEQRVLWNLCLRHLLLGLPIFLPHSYDRQQVSPTPCAICFAVRSCRLLPLSPFSSLMNSD